MGKSSAKLPKPGPFEQQQAAMLQNQRENIMDPTQKALMPLALPAAAQGFNTNLTAPDRQTIEAQYKQSGNDIVNQAGGRGGMLRKAMTMNDIGRAGTVATAANNAKQMGIQRALGLLGPAAFPGANTAVSAGQGLVGSEQNRALRGQQAAASQNAGKGQAAGGLAAAGLMAGMMMM